MTSKSKNPHLGSTLDDFLAEEGIYEEVTTAAIAKVVAWQAGKPGRKAFVTLRFAGDDLDPRDISAILPVEPTRAHRKGEEFFAGEHAGRLRGRTGIWFLATDKLVDSDDLADHLTFVQNVLYPATGATRRISELCNVLERTHSHAHYLLLARRCRRIRAANPGPVRIRDSAIGRRHRSRFFASGGVHAESQAFIFGEPEGRHENDRQSRSSPRRDPVL